MEDDKKRGEERQKAEVKRQKHLLGTHRKDLLDW